MIAGWIVTAIVSIVINVLAYLLAPRVKKQRQDYDAPEVEEGLIIPVGFGTFEVAPQTAAFQNLVTDGGSNSTRYWARMLLPLCHGPVDALIEMLWGDYNMRLIKPFSGASYLIYKSLLSKVLPYFRPLTGVNAGHHVEFWIACEKAYGGDKQQGGFEGQCHVHWGMIDDRFVCEVTKILHGDVWSSKFPGICYATLGWLPTPAPVGGPTGTRFEDVDTDCSDSNCTRFFGAHILPNSGGLDQLDGNCWGMPLGTANGEARREIKIVSLEPGRTYDVRMKIQCVAKGAPVGSTLIGFGLTDHSTLAEEWAFLTDLNPPSPPPPCYFTMTQPDLDGFVLVDGLARFTAPLSGEAWLSYGALGVEYADPCFRTNFFDLRIEGYSAPEDWEGPYRTDDKWGEGWFYMGSNNPAPPIPRFLLRRMPVGLVDAGQGQHANLIACLYEMATDTRWGTMKVPVGRMGLSWAAAALRIREEGLHGSLLMASEREAADWFDQLLQIVDAAVYSDVRTGLFEIQLIRFDYDPLLLPLLDESQVWDLEVHQTQVDELVAELKLRHKRHYPGLEGQQLGEELTPALRLLGDTAVFPLGGTNVSFPVVRSTVGAGPPVTLVEGPDYLVNRPKGLVWIYRGPNVVEGARIDADYVATPVFIGYEEAVRPVHNIAAWLASGAINSRTEENDAVAHEALSHRVSRRLLASASRPLRSGSFRCDRSAVQLHPASPFLLSHPLQDLDGLVCRVVQIDYGSIQEPDCHVTWVEDVFETALPGRPSFPDGEADAAGIGGSTGGTGGGGAGGTNPTRPEGWRLEHPARVFYWPRFNLGLELQVTTDAAGLTVEATVTLPIANQFTYGPPFNFYDYAQTVGTTRYYWLRSVDPAGLLAPSAWLGPIAWTAQAGAPPAAPTARGSSWAVEYCKASDRSVFPIEYEIRMRVYDPQRRATGAWVTTPGGHPSSVAYKPLNLGNYGADEFLTQAVNTIAIQDSGLSEYVVHYFGFVDEKDDTWSESWPRLFTLEQGRIFHAHMPRLGEFPTWVNQGASIVVDEGLHQYVRMDVTETDVRGKVGPLPAAPYDLFVGLPGAGTFLPFSQLTPGQDPVITVGDSWGVMLRESATGKMVLLRQKRVTYSPPDVELYVEKWDSPTVLNSVYVGPVIPTPYPYANPWVRLTDDGVNRTWRITPLNYGPVDWQVLHQVGRTDFITPDQVGFFARKNAVGGTMIMTVVFWQYDEGPLPSLGP